MTKIIGLLAITLAIATHASASATMGEPCQSSGAPVDLDLPQTRDIDFADMPVAVREGMGEHQDILGIETPKHGFDCYGSLESSFACQGDGWWCTCWKIGDKWDCGCETGSC